MANTLISSSSHTLVQHLSHDGREILYGLLVGIFFICWFIGAPILSDFSDTIGRKKALLICLAGALLGFIITAIAFAIHSISLLFAGRIVSGITTGSQPIAQAAMLDLCKETERARFMALIVMAVTIGVILGPMIGGIFSDTDLVSWFDNTTPLVVACIITAVNLVLLWLFFKETEAIEHHAKINLTRAVRVFTSAFKHPIIKPLTILFILMQIGWATYVFYNTPFLQVRFNLTGFYNSMVMILVGVGCSFGFASCGLFEEHFNETKLVIAGYAILTLSVLLTIIIPNLYFSWIIIIPGTFALAVGYSFLLKTFADNVSRDQQGWVMGITSGVIALGNGIATCFDGLLSSLGNAAPMIAAVLLLTIGIIGWAKVNKIN